MSANPAHDGAAAIAAIVRSSRARRPTAAPTPPLRKARLLSPATAPWWHPVPERATGPRYRGRVFLRAVRAGVVRARRAVAVAGGVGGRGARGAVAVAGGVGGRGAAVVGRARRRRRRRLVVVGLRAGAGGLAFIAPVGVIARSWMSDRRARGGRRPPSRAAVMTCANAVPSIAP